MKEEIKKIARHYGSRHQTLKTLEEIGELTIELSKLAILNTTPLHLVSYGEIDNQLAKVMGEIADVEIMLEQMKIYFEISENEIEVMKEIKIERTKERLGL